MPISFHLLLLGLFVCACHVGAISISKNHRLLDLQHSLQQQSIKSSSNDPPLTSDDDANKGWAEFNNQLYTTTHDGIKPFLKFKKPVFLETLSTVSGVNTVTQIKFDDVPVPQLRPNEPINFVHKVKDGHQTVAVQITLKGDATPRGNDDTVSVSIDGVLSNDALKIPKPKDIQQNVITFQLDKSAKGQPYLLTIDAASGSHVDKYTILVEPAAFVAPSMGIEYEYPVFTIRYRQNEDMKQAPLNRNHAVIETAQNPLGLPYVGVQMEVGGPHDSVGGLELVTGAVPFGSSHEAVVDGYRACALFVDVAHKTCKFKPTLLQTHIKSYNDAIDTNKGSFTSPQNFKFVLDNKGKVPVPPDYASGVLAGKGYDWYTSCDFDQDKTGNAQVNFGFPLSAFSPRKNIATNFNNPAHFVDLFGDNWLDATDPPQMSMNAAIRRVLDVADHVVHTDGAFSQLLADRDVTPITKLEARGMISVFLLRIIHELIIDTVHAQMTNAYIDSGKNEQVGKQAQEYQAGWAGAKNLAVNMIKAPVADVMRLLNPHVQSALKTFFIAGDGKAVQATVSLLVKLLFGDDKNTAKLDGSLDVEWYSTMSRTKEGWMEHNHKNEKEYLEVAIPLLTKQLKDKLETYIPKVFKPTAAFVTRYTGETDLVFGTAINRKIEPPGWLKLVGTTDLLHSLPPYKNLGGYSSGAGQVGVVIESRISKSTLNEEFTPKHTLQQAIKHDLTKGLNMLRSITGQV